MQSNRLRFSHSVIEESNQSPLGHCDAFHAHGQCLPLRQGNGKVNEVALSEYSNNNFNAD